MPPIDPAFSSRFRRLFFIMAFVILSAAGPASDAVCAQEVDTDQLAGQSAVFREELSRHRRSESPELGRTAEPEPEPEPEESQEGPTVVVRQIVVEGNTVLPEAQFEPLLSASVGKPFTWGGLKAVARQITGLYRAKGYITCRAYLPPQQIQDGLVRIRVLEGKAGRVSVKGNRHFKNDLYIRDMRLRRDRPLNYREFESGIYRINRRPDRDVHGYLMAGEEPGTSDILLNADESFPMHAAYEFNNRGTNLTHYSRHIVSLTHNNISGRGDILGASLSMAEEGAFTGLGAQYLLPLGASTTLTLETGFSESLLVKHLKHFEIEGESYHHAVSLLHYFIERPTMLFSWEIGLTVDDSQTLIDDLKTSYDRTRAVHTGPRLVMEDGGGRTSMGMDAHVGLPRFIGGLDDTDSRASRPDAGGRFFYVTAEASRLQRIAWGSLLLLRAGGQWSDDNLTSVERYRLGGAYSVRGYPESDSSGDQGFDASAEWRRPVPVFGAGGRRELSVAAFVDAGKTFSLQRTQPTDTKDRFLMGAGVGLRYDINPYAQYRLDWAYPIGDESSDKDRPRLHLSLRHSF